MTINGRLSGRFIWHQIHQSRSFRKLETNSVDSPEQVGVVDLPPFVAGKRVTLVDVVGDVAGVVGDVADIGGEAIHADWICASSVVVVVKLLRLVV